MHRKELKTNGNLTGNGVRGFSLVELLIVVTILAILLGLALPRYGDYLDKARRNDGRGALLELAAQQERIHFERNRYSASMDDLWSNKSGDAYVSHEGYYTLSVTTADSHQQFTLTATARGVQAGDEECASLSIDNTGAKIATDGTDDTSSTCW